MSKSYAKTRIRNIFYHERKIVEIIGSDKNNFKMDNSSITLIKPLTAIVRKRWSSTPTHMLSNHSITFYVAASSSSSLVLFCTANSFICLFTTLQVPMLIHILDHCIIVELINSFAFFFLPLHLWIQVFCCSLRLHKKWHEEISTRFTYQLKVSEEDSMKYSYFSASAIYTHVFSNSGIWVGEKMC